jgi:outer membrane immunogenic protein
MLRRFSRRGPGLVCPGLNMDDNRSFDMNKLAALALSATVLAPFAASAGGMAQPIPEPTVAPVVIPVVATPDWTGWYGGASLGYGSVSADGLDGSDAIGGLLGGYRHDFGNWVGGVEADYDWSNISVGDNTGVSLDSVYRLKLQAGADLGKTFLYGTAGMARATVGVNGTDFSSNGWVAGVGADYAINEKWLVGGEVLYNKFDNFANSDINGDMTTVKARVAYRF